MELTLVLPKFYMLKILVDSEDYDRVNGEYWSFNGAKRSILKTPRGITMGRFILKYNGPLQVDHKDRDILNNQKSNFRLATNEQQCANRGPQRHRF